MVRIRLNAGPITAFLHVSRASSFFITPPPVTSPSAVPRHISLSLCLLWLVWGLHWPTCECACFTLSHSFVTESRWLTQHWLEVMTLSVMMRCLFWCCWIHEHDKVVRSCRLCLPWWRQEEPGWRSFPVNISFSVCVCVWFLTHFFPHVLFETDSCHHQHCLRFTVHECWSKQTYFLLILTFMQSYQPRVWSCFFPLKLPQCTQSTKGVLERVFHSLDFHDLCLPGTPKTTPIGLEGSSSAVLSPEPSALVGCAQQPTLQSVVAPCPLAPFSRGNKRDSLHSTNPAFRLASPSPSLSRAGFVLEDAPEVSFVPLPWRRPKTDTGLGRFLNAPLRHRGETPRTGGLRCVLPFENPKISQPSCWNFTCEFAFASFCVFLPHLCLSRWS